MAMAKVINASNGWLINSLVFAFTWTKCVELESLAWLWPPVTVSGDDCGFINGSWVKRKKGRGMMKRLHGCLVTLATIVSKIKREKREMVSAYRSRVRKTCRTACGEGDVRRNCLGSWGWRRISTQEGHAPGNPATRWTATIRSFN